MIRLTLLIALYKQDINNITLCKIDYKFIRHDCQDNQQIFTLAQGNDTLEIGNCASSQFIQESSCLLLYMANSCNFIIIINNVVLIIIQLCL